MNETETTTPDTDPFASHVRYYLQDSGSAYEARSIALYPCPYGEPGRSIVYHITPTPDAKRVIFRPVNPEDQGMQTTGADFVTRLLEDKILARCDAEGNLAPEDIRFAPVLPVPAPEAAVAMEEIADTMPPGDGQEGDFLVLSAVPGTPDAPAEEPHE
jgi:hypothetical protein